MIDSVRHDETGLLVPPDDPEALAAAILALLDDPAQARRLGGQGRALMLREFTLTKTVDDIDRLYQRLLAGGRPEARSGNTARRRLWSALRVPVFGVRLLPRTLPIIAGVAGAKLRRLADAVRRRTALWRARISRERRLTPPQLYDSATRPRPWLEELIQLARYRDLVRELVSRNVKARYKRSVLGLLWTMLNPIAMMVILSLVFSGLFSITVPNYSVYLLAGLLFWNFFAQATIASTSEIVWGASWANRIYVPKTVFAVAAVASGVVNLVLSLVPLLLVMLTLGVRPGPALVQLPLALTLGACFTLGVALVISSLAVRFADFVEIYQIALTAWMYLTPVIYPLEIIPAHYRRLFVLNPMLHLMAAFRGPICDGRLSPLETLVVSTAVSLATLVLGWWLFTRNADQIAYRT